MKARAWFPVDTGIYDNAKIRAAGRDAREVYLFVLAVNRIERCDGRLPPEVVAKHLAPVRVAAKLAMTPAEAEAALSRCLSPGIELLAETGDGSLEVVGWDEEWRPKSAAERTRAWRERRSGDVTVTSHVTLNPPCDVTVTSPVTIETEKRHGSVTVTSPPLSSSSSGSGSGSGGLEGKGRTRRRAAQGDLIPPPPKEPPVAQKLREVWDPLFAAANGGALPTWDRAAWVIAAGLLGQHGIAEVLRRARIYWGPGCPDWIARGGRDLKGFRASFDRVASPAVQVQAGWRPVPSEPGTLPTVDELRARDAAERAARIAARGAQ